MINKKITVAARILLILYLFAIGYICFGTFNRVPQICRLFLGFESDKVVHFLMFLPFPFLLYFSRSKDIESPGKAMIFSVLVFIVGCFIAMGTEMIQTAVPGRNGDRLDFLADAYALAFSSISILIIDLVRHFHKCSKKS